MTATQRASAMTGLLSELRMQSHVEVLPHGGLMLRIQKELRKPNAFWGRHWAGKQGKSAAKKDWAVALTNAIAINLGGREVLRWLSTGSGIPGATGQCTTKRRVTVQRLVPSRRHFIRDEDNLVFAEKPLYDALVTVGLLRDDSTQWVQRVREEQAVSKDGTHWTFIEIGPAEGDSVQWAPGGATS